MENAETGSRTAQRVASVSEPAPDDRFDLVLIPVRAEQLDGVLPVLTGMMDGSDVLFFGNTGNRGPELTAALGERALFGFPAAGGTRDGPTIKYVLIRQQKTMLGEPDRTTTSRIRHLQHVLDGAGFPTLISADIGGWLTGHAAFVVPIAFALYRVGIDAPRLAADPDTMRLMVLATREAFTALHAVGNEQVPATCAPSTACRRFSSSPTGGGCSTARGGELWFGAHSRAAPEEMHALARDLQEAMRHTGRPTPSLDRLLDTPA